MELLEFVIQSEMTDGKASQKLEARLKESPTPDLQHRNPVPYWTTRSSVTNVKIVLACTLCTVLGGKVRFTLAKFCKLFFGMFKN
jgi:hypothetical protein